MKLTASVTLNQLAWEALVSIDALSAVDVPVRLVGALRTYLDDKSPERPGWRFPAFAKDAAGGNGQVAVEIEVEGDTWRAFEAEAASQGVTTDELAAQAAFYLAAQVDAGRLLPRILSEIESD